MGPRKDTVAKGTRERPLSIHSQDQSQPALSPTSTHNTRARSKSVKAAETEPEPSPEDVPEPDPEPDYAILEGLPVGGFRRCPAIDQVGNAIDRIPRRVAALTPYVAAGFGPLKTSAEDFQCGLNALRLSLNAAVKHLPVTVPEKAWHRVISGNLSGLQGKPIENTGLKRVVSRFTKPLSI